ncbi:MAG: site-specific integrase [Myxococcota bacterium]|nr:site-specific integrase [Myxococcota bacterium]
MSSSTPEPIPLTIGSTRLATAYPHRPPSERAPHWSWRMVWSADGKRHQRSLGRLPVDGVEEALLHAWAFIDPSSIPVDPSGVRTMVDLSRAWFASVERRPPETGVSPSTLDIYRRACVYIRETIGREQVSKLSNDAFVKLVDTMALPSFRERQDARNRKAMRARGQLSIGPAPDGSGYGHRTINLTLTVLGMILRWGRERDFGVPGGLEPKRFMLKAKKGQEPSRYRRHTPTTQELERFVSGLRKMPLKLAVLLGWRTGARIGELGALRWRDIEQVPGGGFVRLTGKTGTRRVAISTATVEEVLSFKKKHAQPDTRLFSGKFGRRGGARLIAGQQRQGIPEDRQFTFHGLRRRWSADQIEAGVPINVYADQAGHSPEVALRHYAVVTDRERIAASVRVEAMAGAKDIYAQLADRGLSVEAALELIDAALQERVAAKQHLRMVKD